VQRGGNVAVERAWERDGGPELNTTNRLGLAARLLESRSTTILKMGLGFRSLWHGATQ
jgi:hypothetical protein